MKIGSAFGKITAVCAVALVALTVKADGWDWTRPFKRSGRDVTTLVITGNYKRPLALAQLIRSENRQPYLLVPAQESGLKDVFFCPVDERTPAIKLRAEDISRFVNLLNPKKVIILGDTRYVPENYVPELGGRIPIVRIDCDDWNRCAEVLGSMLNLNYLERDYRRIGAKLDSDALYRPLPSGQTSEGVTVPASVDEVAAEEVSAPAVEEAAPAPAPAEGEVTPGGEVTAR